MARRAFMPYETGPPSLSGRVAGAARGNGQRPGGKHDGRAYRCAGIMRRPGRPGPGCRPALLDRVDAEHQVSHWPGPAQAAARGGGGQQRHSGQPGAGRADFLAVWRGADGYRPAGAAGGWLWGIARRQAALWLRHGNSFTPNEPWSHDPVSPDDLAARAAVRLDLADAVAGLAPGEGRAWRLLHVEDRPVAEVAELMGIPEGTVKSRAHRARRLLRAALRVGGTP